MELKSLCCPQAYLITKRYAIVCSYCSVIFDFIKYKKICEICKQEYEAQNVSRSRYCGSCSVNRKNELSKKYKKYKK